MLNLSMFEKIYVYLPMCCICKNSKMYYWNLHWWVEAWLKRKATIWIRQTNLIKTLISMSSWTFTLLDFYFVCCWVDPGEWGSDHALTTNWTVRPSTSTATTSWRTILNILIDGRWRWKLRFRRGDGSLAFCKNCELVKVMKWKIWKVSIFSPKMSKEL